MKRHSAQHTCPQGVMVARVGGEKHTGQTYEARGSASARVGSGMGSDGFGAGGDSDRFRFFEGALFSLASGELGSASTSMGEGPCGGCGGGGCAAF